MKKNLKAFLLGVVLALSASFAAANEGANYPKANIDLGDQVALQRGAQIFTNYCISCHSAAGLRYNRLQDLGLSEEQIKKNMMFTTDKIGDTMVAAIAPADAQKWFGTVPPDLTLIARSRGADYLYAYMRGFYKDPTRPSGWNNTVLKGAAMPHPLWMQQGVVPAVKLDDKGQPVMKKDPHSGALVPDLQFESADGKIPPVLSIEKGRLTTRDYDDYVRSLVTYMVWMGEPAQTRRHQIGYVVLMFLVAVLLPLAYFLKKEYWKDVH